MPREPEPAPCEQRSDDPDAWDAWKGRLRARERRNSIEGKAGDRARNRSWVRLMNKYPADYTMFFNEEYRRAYQEVERERA